jgi:hypothetical protein
MGRIRLARYFTEPAMVGPTGVLLLAPPDGPPFDGAP